MNNKVRICINLDQRLLKEFDKAIKNDYRSTRTEVIRMLMRRYIKDIEETKKIMG